VGAVYLSSTMMLNHLLFFFLGASLGFPLTDVDMFKLIFGFPIIYWKIL